MRAERATVTKANELIDANGRLTPTERDLITFGVGILNPVVDGPVDLMKDLTVRFSLKEYADFHGVPKNSRGSLYRNLRQVVQKQLFNRTFSYRDKERKEKVTCRWIITHIVDETPEMIGFRFHPEILPLLINIKRGFTSVPLSKLSGYRSPYAHRLFEILNAALDRVPKNSVTKTYPIEELKAVVEVPEGSYRHFFNFKQKVLEPCRKEINLRGDISISYTVEKLGTRPKAVVFKVSYGKNGKPRARCADTVDMLGEELTNEAMYERIKGDLPHQAIREAGVMIRERAADRDVYTLLKEFATWVNTNKRQYPRKIDTAFMGFVNKKIGGDKQSLIVAIKRMES